MTNNSQKRRKIAGIAGTLILSGTALAACGNSATSGGTTLACGSNSPKLTVQGSGQATSVPNLLTLNAGVNVSAASAQSALSQANSAASSLSKALLNKGLAPSDIQTTNLSVQPNYARNGTISAYQVTNSIIVKIHNLQTAGALIDAAARSAGNAIQIQGLSFSVANTATMDGEARASAIHVAGAHARSMAGAAGKSLLGICSITDSTTSPYPVPYMQGLAISAGASMSPKASSVPVQPGTQQSNAQVTVVYALGPSVSS